MITRPIRFLLLFAPALLAGCAGWFAPPPGVGREIGFSRLPGWTEDRHSEAWPALLRSCDKLQGRGLAWEHLCLAARTRDAPGDDEARAFFEQFFTARVVDGDGGRDGLITGYYEPRRAGTGSLCSAR